MNRLSYRWGLASLLVMLMAFISGRIQTTNAFSSIGSTSKPSLLYHRNRLSFVDILSNNKKSVMENPTLSSPLRLSSQSAEGQQQEERAVVGWTVANLFWINDTLLNVYHAAGVAWDNLVPEGALLGAVAYATGIYQPYPTLLQTTGDAAFWTGIIVMALNVLKLFLWDTRQESFGSMQKEAEELRMDYNKRVMDQSVWMGVFAGGVPLLVAGGPEPIGLAAGTSGVLQCLCLGSVSGSLLGWYRQQR